ncbi:MAG: DUF3015 family protein [Bdellovibrionales bacterium]
MKKVLVLFSLVFSTNAFAVGDAGCGLGSLVISKNSKLLQLFAVTTNGTFGSQTFGITSGTSNCSASGFVMNDKQIEYYVEVNQEDLSREIAQGHGDKLSTLAALHGCGDEASVKSFSTKAQANYEVILPSAHTSADTMVKNMKTLSMANVCQGS